jgi:hypothetical protein
MVVRRALLVMLCWLAPAHALRAETTRETQRPARQSADCQLCSEGAGGLELAVPLWLPFVGIDGERTEGEIPQHVKFEAELEFAIVAQATLRLGPVGVSLSANGASLGTRAVNSNTGETLGNVDLAMYFGRATVNWYTPPFRYAEGPRTELLAIWPYLGVRYAVLSGKRSTAEGELLFEGETTWGEPLYGGEILLDLRRGWLFKVAGDVGGFSLGSEISVWSAIEAQYAATNWLNIHVGWTLYYARLELGDVSGSILLQGPAAGIGLPLF